MAVFLKKVEGRRSGPVEELVLSFCNILRTIEGVITISEMVAEFKVGRGGSGGRTPLSVIKTDWKY